MKICAARSAQTVLSDCNPLCLRVRQCAELITGPLLTALRTKILRSRLLSQEAANGHSRGSVLFLVGNRDWESAVGGCRQPRACGKPTLLLAFRARALKESSQQAWDGVSKGAPQTDRSICVRSMNIALGQTRYFPCTTVRS